MFKILALIGLILVGNVFAAQTTEDESAKNLETIVTRIVLASAFEMTAQLASLEDARREELNASLINQFDETGAHSFLELKAINTQEEAIDARNYYRNAKNALSALRANLRNQMFSVPTDK